MNVKAILFNVFTIIFDMTIEYVAFPFVASVLISFALFGTFINLHVLAMAVAVRFITEVLVRTIADVWFSVKMSKVR